MNRDEIRAEVKRLIGKVTSLEPEEIPDTAFFQDDLELDSLAMIETRTHEPEQPGLFALNNRLVGIRMESGLRDADGQHVAVTVKNPALHRTLVGQNSAGDHRRGHGVFAHADQASF